MTKPILVVRFPYEELALEKLERISKQLEKKLNDYHVLCMIENKVESVVFECYNVPDVETKFEDLKREVLHTINSL